ncbi:alpha/beta fold hydrolase [Flavobacterium sp.]|uniref:alpha/beta fold hydrolase n=1 Tax=Flavobacterium sp. TaxID=239 RepID=UPI00286D7534|nr:alpha/beta fold hydrolase [Flavobacterium sp.]
MLKQINIGNWILEKGNALDNIPLFYQTFGQPIGNSPVVLVNHALTGNSNVTGEKGWWNELIGENKIIDTNFFTIIAFNIPGNGFDGNEENLIENYKDFTIRDIATIFWLGLKELKINSLFATIGGSLGGAIAWEMAVLHPKKIQNVIPIASDYKATDWMIANVLIQDNILNNSKNPIEDARIHAMLLYRTPQSINQRFQRKQNPNQNFEIENWLKNHGEKLKNRFQLSAYKLMNHLLKTNDIVRNRDSFLVISNQVQGNIHLVSVDSDLFFTPDQNLETYHQLKKIKQNIFYHEIKSIHGHDAFLIEFDQLSHILNPIFNKIKQQNYVKN